MRRGTGRRLMFIYDETEVIDVFKSQFSVLGYEVLVAQSFASARMLARKLKPQVIVSDAIFGNDVLKETDENRYGNLENLLSFVERDLPDTKVIVLAAWLPEEQITKWTNRVFAIYLKPISFEEITSGIERAFGLRKATAGDKMPVNPIWRGRGFAVSQLSCFVLMPFGAPWSTRIWERHLKPIIESCGFEAQRADDFTGHDVMEDVWKGLNQAQVVIADITGRNPNVFYELGIAHTLGKNVILITQNLGEVAFDVNRYRIVEYEDNSDGYDKLRGQLTKHLSALKSSQN